jgi:hypothetical protein
MLDWKFCETDSMLVWLIFSGVRGPEATHFAKRIYCSSGALMAKDDLEGVKRLMWALVKRAPKPHEAMKLGRKKRVAESKKKDSTARKKKGGRRPSSSKSS